MNETLDEQSRWSLVRYRIERADETIDEAKLLAGDGHFNAAMSRLYTKGTVLFVYFSWWFVDYCLSLHHYLKCYAKKSKRKEWYWHLPRHA